MTKLWQITDNALQPMSADVLSSERQLHDWLERDIGVLDGGLLIIGREVPTAHGGRIDLLAIDEEGALSIIELKRDRTPRDVIAQALDYASWVADLDTPTVHGIADAYWRSKASNFADAFAARFDCMPPEPLNSSHRIVVVAGSLDAASQRIVEYLSQRHGVGINTAFFSVFRTNESQFLAADWLMDQAEVSERTERRVRSPWNGDYYVNVGEGSHRCWNDMRKFGFVAGGHGKSFADDMKRLTVGSPIWVYLKGKGYVGHGRVTATARMARDVVIDVTPLLDLGLEAPGLGDDRDDADMAEYVATVEWTKTLAPNDARNFSGMFSNQHAACRLTDTRTLEFLEREFGAAV